MADTQLQGSLSGTTQSPQKNDSIQQSGTLQLSGTSSINTQGTGQEIPLGQTNVNSLIEADTSPAKTHSTTAFIGVGVMFLLAIILSIIFLRSQKQDQL